ncbi:unnamed protein product [Rotaria magnacalcarata]|uniref:Centrosomal protein POC5 n=1 Tax=Rotaria magnacalcarata TaxID=392030 RepID=A0A816G1Z9_9BILA|nr:unnamed protein product [Rotaria magnacalcarata]
MSVNIDLTQSKNDHVDLLEPTNDSLKSQILIESEQRKNDRTDIPQPGNDCQLKQTLSNEQQCSSKDYDEQTAYHRLLYTETKSITEKMDVWYLDMKKNLMYEFDKLRLQYLEEAQQNNLREKEIQVKDYIRLNEDIKVMREMLIHYERKIDQKDQTESNVNKALDILSKKMVAYRHYYEWRIIFVEKKRRKYSLLLAKRFYENKIKRKALVNWKRLIEQEWRQRFELSCEKKIKSMLNKLRNEYETKYKQLELQLLNANEEIARLRTHRNVHDEPLKTAFMRGVCALNMEAMSVLFKDGHESDTTRVYEKHPQREYSKHEDNDATDEHLNEEEVTINSSSTADDEENELRYSSYHHTCPTHVYKEYLPSSTDSTSEGRRFAQSNNHNRHLTLPKHSSMATNRPRYTNSNILSERNEHSSNIFP